MSRIFEQLLQAREYEAGFLSPKYEECVDADLLPDMAQAVGRIRKAVVDGEKIIIYGDYDVDGVTASTVMYDTLRLAGVKAENLEIMLPNRFLDGYGMSRRVVERAKESGAKLVITVDCGSRNHEVIEELKGLGVDVIVTDHHEVGDTLPPAVAVVNPKRKDAWTTGFSGDAAARPVVTGEPCSCRSPLVASAPEKTSSLSNFSAQESLRELAGVGVAFKVAQALVKAGEIPTGQEKWLLDLVLIGTICDSMVLRGENRRLCYFGMKVLEKTRRPGLKELMREAGVKRLDTEAIGFQIGPRLNAAGRMETAEKALELVRAEKKTLAAKLALELEELNSQRKKQQADALEEIRQRGVGEEPVIVVEGEWHEGVLGIIAGRLVEEYQRPAFVLARPAESPAVLEKLDATSGHQKPVSSRKSSADVTALTFAKQVSDESGASNISQTAGDSAGSDSTSEDKHGRASTSSDNPIVLKGSGRSFGEFNLAEALTVCGQYIIGGGGHAAACGVKVAKDKLEKFREAVNEYYRSLKLENQERFLGVQEDLMVEEFEELSLELIEEMRKLEPYGEGNQEPVFLLPEVRVVDVAKLGVDGKHLRLTVWDKQGKSLKLMQFFAPEENLGVQPGSVVNVWMTLAENEFRGIRSVEGRILELAVL